MDANIVTIGQKGFSAQVVLLVFEKFFPSKLSLLLMSRYVLSLNHEYSMQDCFLLYHGIALPSI